MSLLSFLYISVAVLQGTVAQLFPKAGTNAAPVGLGLALEPRIPAGIGIIIVGVALVARS